VKIRGRGQADYETRKRRRRRGEKGVAIARNGTSNYLAAVPSELVWCWNC
jgi:hypothetical protein